MNDGCANVLGGVNDLFDPWNALSDLHTRNAGEMKGLQRHLRA